MASGSRRLPQLGNQSRLKLRMRDADLIADGPRRRLLDLTMPRDSNTSTVSRISVNKVACALTIQVTAMLFQVPNEVAAFHAAGTSTVSFPQMAFPGASLAAFSR